MKQRGFSAIFLIIIVALICIGTAFYLINSSKINFIPLLNSDSTKYKYSEEKIVDLITTERQKPSSDPQYVLRSDNIQIGDPDGDYIYLRFKPEIVDNESLKDFERYSEPENTVINVSLPEKSIDNNIPIINEWDNTLRNNLQINFDSYDNGILKGYLTTKVSKAGYIVNENSPDCRTGDILGVCTKYIDLDIKLRVFFTVKVK